MQRNKVKHGDKKIKQKLIAHPSAKALIQKRFDHVQSILNNSKIFLNLIERDILPGINSISNHLK